MYALWSYQNRKHPVGHIDTLSKFIAFIYGQIYFLISSKKSMPIYSFLIAFARLVILV